MKLSIAQAGFLKGIGVAILAAAVAYLSDPSHLTFLSSGAALIVAGLASSLESYIKDQTGKALFGAAPVRK